jgi:hypothetical protein
MEYAVFIFGLLGLLFSGYLSGTKFFTDTCAFNEACPYFFGVPACYFGFALFVSIFLFSGLHVFHKMKGKLANQVVLFSSSLGVLYAGYFTALELPILFSNGFNAYFLSLPTCAFGFIVFALVAILSYKLKTTN